MIRLAPSYEVKCVQKSGRLFASVESCVVHHVLKWGSIKRLSWRLLQNVKNGFLHFDIQVYFIYLDTLIITAMLYHLLLYSFYRRSTLYFSWPLLANFHLDSW